LTTAGCSGSVTLHHPRTGATTTCGPYLDVELLTCWYPSGMIGVAMHPCPSAQERLQKCIQERRLEGYIEAR